MQETATNEINKLTEVHCLTHTHFKHMFHQFFSLRVINVYGGQSWTIHENRKPSGKVNPRFDIFNLRKLCLSDMVRL